MIDTGFLNAYIISDMVKAESIMAPLASGAFCAIHDIGTGIHKRYVASIEKKAKIASAANNIKICIDYHPIGRVSYIWSHFEQGGQNISDPGDLDNFLDGTKETIILDNQTVDASNSHDIETQPADPSDPVMMASILLKIWSTRTDHFRASFPEISEMSWNILLDLMVSADKHMPVVVSDLVVTYETPKSTMVRYVDYLCSVGLIEKERDQSNKVRVLLTLTDEGRKLTEQAVGKISGILPISVE